jgi:hypothetical protein
VPKTVAFDTEIYVKLKLTKAELKRRSCKGKKRYRSAVDALFAVIRSEINGMNGLRSYKCLFGKHWHIGHSRGAKKRNWNVKRSNCFSSPD